EVVKREMGFDFPQDPLVQMQYAIKAVFGSWNSKRAIDYRRRENIPDSLGTAVNIQTMVFGNMGDDSGTGVAFTRDPQTGDNKMFGEYLINAQGEDVVAGIRNTSKIEGLKAEIPDAYHECMRVSQTAEEHFRDMQDVEFTIERGKLWMLQTRKAKPAAKAGSKIGADLGHGG